ncbi:MAG: hypothetical protein AB1Z67_07590 [Candidatus Limnocylindrales bacterium]
MAQEPAGASDEFPWPTLATPYETPLPPAFQPKGKPVAMTTKHGIRVELWLSTDVAMPGEWVQAVVRTTNLRGTPAWAMPTSCGRSGTAIGVDASDPVPQGDDQVGNGAEFKRRAAKRAPYLWEGAYRRKEALRWVTGQASGWSGQAFVECPGPPEPRRLKPFATTTERFVWYAASSFDEEKWFQPLWPGAASMTVTWPYLGHGAKPGTDGNLWDRVKRIKATATFEIGGDGPGTPSNPELIDLALEHPRFRAWVDEDETRDSWHGTSWAGSAGPTYPHNLYAIGLEDAPSNGLVWLELDRTDRTGPRDTWGIQRGVVTMDPWTGEVVRVHCMGSGSPSCAKPTVLDEPEM